MFNCVLRNYCQGARSSTQYDYYPILYAAVNTGLRLGELLGLRWQDVDGDVLHVRQQWTKAETLEEPKTKHGRRRVPLSQDVADSFCGSSLRGHVSR